MTGKPKGARHVETACCLACTPRLLRQELGSKSPRHPLSALASKLTPTFTIAISAVLGGSSMNVKLMSLPTPRLKAHSQHIS